MSQMNLILQLLGRDFIYKAKPDLVFINGRYQLRFKKKNEELFGFKINLLPGQTKAYHFKVPFNQFNQVKACLFKAGEYGQILLQPQLKKAEINQS